MCPHTHQITYTGLTDTDRIDTVGFLVDLSRGTGELLYFEQQADGLVVDCSQAPEVWDMLYGLQQAALKGEITVTDVEYIPEPERPRA